MTDTFEQAKKNSLLPLVISFTLSLLILFHYSGYHTSFENLALGEDNLAYFASYGENRIHCTGIKDAGLCLDSIDKLSPAKVILWLGNSQLNSINQYKIGDKTAAQILFETLFKKQVASITFSPPNSSLQEHFILFEYMLIKTKIDLLILPVCFDDTRETGIRADIAAAFKDSKALAAISASPLGRQLIRNTKIHGPSEDDFVGVKATIQERVEYGIEETLNKYSNIWRARKEVRGLFFDFLYRLRNALLNITPQSKRRLIKDRYDDNLRAFEEILKKAEKANVKVLVYIPPIRSDVESPYERSEYQQFKIKIRKIARRHSASYANFEAIVPGGLWGYKNSTSLKQEKLELDFMHFKGQGHQILAANILTKIKALIQNDEKTSRDI